MFEKIYEKFESLRCYIRDEFSNQSNSHYDVKKLVKTESESIRAKLDKMEQVITSQQRTIEQLTNALKDKYEHGLFIFSEDCKIPMVIRNGKEITNDMVSRFCIDWVHGEAPNIEIEQFVGTVSDMEN